MRPQQLPLFQSAGQLMSDLVGGAASTAEGNLASSPQRLMDSKLQESLATRVPGKETSASHGAGVYKSIKEHGFQGHITMGHRDFMGNETPAPQVNEGHHALAAAADIEKTTGKTQWVGIDWEGDQAGESNHYGTFSTYNDRYPQNPGNAQNWKEPS